MAASWENRAADKRARIEGSIPTEWKIQSLPKGASVMDFPEKSGILSAEELAITKLPATDLVVRLARGELKSVDVTLAFCKRAALAHQLAKALDVYYEQYKKPVGPLHGLPISLKDQLRIKGLETSMGYVSWLGKYEKEDSILTALLRKAGAVFYVKTSVPQALMFGETINNITGRTVNPRNKAWSCGGSSGGEGAMIGIHGGCMGVGTDIGGSIRIPAAFNFLYGIRPSHGRMPYGKMANSNEGQETVHSVVGPIAHSASGKLSYAAHSASEEANHCGLDLRLFMTSVLSEEPWKYDPKVVPLPWRSDEEEAIKAKVVSGGLNLGFFNCDGQVLPHPPILRAVDTVVSTLKKSGHNVVPWTPYKHDFAVDLIDRISAADGYADALRDINASGEPPVPNIEAMLNSNTKKLDMNELWEAHLKKWTFQCEYLGKWMELEQQLGKELDAIVAPVTATAAIRHDQFRYYGYTTVINLLDFTSVVVPVTFTDKAIDNKIDEFNPLNAMDAKVQAEYDPTAYHGAPVAVQIIGRRLSEERTLAIAEEVGRLLETSRTEAQI